MGRFLLRRLLLALVTLFGISLITFALIHLAPGDAVTGGGEGNLQPITRDEIEAMRRLYFLDLPLFFNPAPRGLGARAERLLREKRSEALRRCGTVCLPALARQRKRDPTAREGIDRVVAAIRRDHPGLEGEASTETWIEGVLERIKPEAVRRLTRDLGRRPEASRRLIQLGSAALPQVMDKLLDGEAEARYAASEVVSEITGIQGRIGREDTEDSDRNLASWSEWWFQHRRDYVAFSRWERLHGRLTETQFAKWMFRILTFRFGHSTRDGRPVLDKLGAALPITLLLSLLSMTLAYLIAIPLGVHAAIHQGRPSERLITVLLFILYSLPSFWVAMMLILLLGGVGVLDWFPIYGLSSPGLEQATGWTWLTDRIWHLVLPVTCLTYGSLAVISRYQRSAMLEVIRQDYIRTARAKGLNERAVIFKHALRNALLPTITLLGLQLPYLISGSVIIERIFNIPGMGLMTFEAFLNRDYPVIMAVSVLSAAITLLGLILADLFYSIADPRITLDRTGVGA